MKSDERKFGLDLIKFWAIIGVVIIHSCNYSLPVTSSNFAFSLLWGSVTRASVPLFLMTSGALMLSKQYSLKKLFGKNLLRIIAAMLFWGFMYKVFHLWQNNALSFDAIIQGAKEVLLFKQEFHLYYLHIIIIVYLFLPVTSVLVKNANKAQLEYMLLIWLFFSVIYPCLRLFWPFNLFGSITNLWELNLVYSSIGYTVFGYYINKFNPFKKCDFLLAILGFLLTFCLTFYVSLKQGFLYETFLSGTSVGVCLLASGVFSMLNRADIKSERFSFFVKNVSKGSFAIYLIHIIFLEILKDVGFTANILPSVISIPLISFAVFVLSLVSYFILAKIPILNKWVI